MHQLITPRIAMLLAGALVALVLAGPGGGRSTESVTCSSTSVPHDSSGRLINLTGTWIGSDRQLYSLRQIGSCLWWAGGPSRSNVFFGTIFGSTVTGQWADLSGPTIATSGRVTLLISSSMRGLLRRSFTGSFPARSWKKTS
jgi:hypothetical protein